MASKRVNRSTPVRLLPKAQKRAYRRGWNAGRTSNVKFYLREIELQKRITAHLRMVIDALKVALREVRS